MQTTIIDVKFDEELKSKLRIGLPCKVNREIAKTCRKTWENSKKLRKSVYNLFRKIYGIPKIFLAQITYNLLYFRII